MNTINSIRKVLRLHELIQSEVTGTPAELSMRLCIPSRTIRYYLQELRDFGAEIGYDKNRCTYYYMNDFSIVLHFEVKVSAPTVLE